MRAKSTIFAAVAVFCFVLIFATQGRADSMDSFVYQFGGNTFTWQLLSSPPVAPENAFPGLQFVLTDVSVRENGGAAVLGTMDFYSASNDAGGGMDFFTAEGVYFFDVFGPQFYSGSEASPTFLIGTFTSLTDFGNTDGPLPGTGKLKIAGTVVPEPPSLLLLILGLASGLAIYCVRTLTSPLRSVY
jgi:hypothetical protein